MRLVWLIVLILPSLVLAQAGEATLLDRISLQAEASKEVGNDRMHAALAVEQEDRDPSRLAQQVNRTMQWALAQAGEVKSVTAATVGYRTEPVYRDKTLSHWRAVQLLLLESGDFAALSGLIGRLQARLTVKSIRFSIADATRRQVEDRLIDQALAAYGERADRVSHDLGAGGWRIVQLNVDTAGVRPGPITLYRAEAAAEPAFQAGTNKLTVTVSGTVQLLPGHTGPK